jgi:hypothetical protein
MESRLTKLETSADYIQRDIEALKRGVEALKKDVHAIRTTDFQLIFGAIIALAVGLSGVMAKGFQWL